MESHLGHSVIRNFDYSQPFEEGVVNKGRKGHRNTHIVSKTCLDIFLPLQKKDLKEAIHKGSAAQQNEKHVEFRQKLNIEDVRNTALTSKVSSVDVKSSTPTLLKTRSVLTGDANFDGKERKCAKDNKDRETIMTGQKRQPPLVVFAYGGGWRRGDKQTWRHYISRWDVNFGLAAMVGRDRFYSNIGESFVSSGIPCAILSYPLVPTPFPINLLEIVSSFVISFAVILMIALSLILMLDVALISLSFPSLMQISWESLQYNSDYPILTIAAMAVIVSQLLTLGVILSREFSIKSQDQFERKTSLLKAVSLFITFMAIIWTVSKTDICSLCSYIANYIHLPWKVSGGLVLFVQYLVYRFQQMTTFDHTSSRSCLVANPKGQVECIALALRWLVDYGRSTGHFDPESLVLMGHSAGGHLLSLVALDHHYLTDVGIDPRIIKGVITLSAVHNLRSISEGLPYYIYLKPAFGNDRSNWTSMSPIEYIKIHKNVIKTVFESQSPHHSLCSAPAFSSLNTTPTTFPSHISSSNSSAPHRPRFLIISAAKDFVFMIRDSEIMHSTLEMNGYQTKRNFFQGCNHFTMVRKFGCPWYRYWTGLVLGTRRSWEPTDGELMCWDFVKQFWNCE